jgi:c-di-GMP-binding flagellar brake protein YcgR
VQSRRYFRIATSLQPQRARALDRPDRELDPAAFTILELSGAGLLAKTAEELALEEGERLLLSLALDGESIEVAVAVAWVHPVARSEAVETGCRFERLTSRDQIAILDHIRRHQIRAIG